MRTVILAAALAGVGLVGASSTAGGTAAAGGSRTAPVQTTEVGDPADQRTETVRIDTAAVVAQMAVLPDPFPTTTPADRCVDLEPGTVTFPLFDGGSVAIAGTSAQLCEETSWWTLSWRGQNDRPGGGVDSSGSAVVLFELDGTLRSGILANLEVGPTSYRFTPVFDQPDIDLYERVGYNFPPPLEVAQTSPPSTVATAAPAGSAAAPATAVRGAPGYTG